MCNLLKIFNVVTLMLYLLLFPSDFFCDNHTNSMGNDLIKSVKLKTKRNPIRSMRKMAREAGVSEGTIRKIIKNQP